MQRFILTVLGKAGSGKTTLIRRVVETAPRPVFILDTMNDFSRGLAFESMRDVVRFLRDGRPNRTGVYIVKATTDDDCEAFFRFFTTVKEPATVVVDEASKFCSPYEINPDLKQMISYGRHWGQNLVFAARRTAEIHRDLTAQSDAIVSFRQTEPRDVKALEAVWSEAAVLPELDPTAYEYVILGDWEHLPVADALRKGAIKNAPVQRSVDTETGDSVP